MPRRGAPRPRQGFPCSFAFWGRPAAIAGGAALGAGAAPRARWSPAKGLEVYDVPSRDCLTGRGGNVRPPVVLGRWRASGDHLPSPGAPARPLRPMPAAQGPAPLLQPDSQRPPGAAGRARGGAPKTRRAETRSRPRLLGSLGGSLQPRVYHSHPYANARVARAHQSGEFLPL
jgi:hypothetical protein